MIIVDANAASEFMDKTDEAKAIVRWIMSRGKLSAGGKNLEELVKTPIRDFLLQLERAGKLVRADKDQVDTKEEEIKNRGIRSDDPHVIALAIVGGARLLYSYDQALIQDFTDTNIVPRPVGKCYRYANKHRHLLC